jgi:hypothetical protein
MPPNSAFKVGTLVGKILGQTDEFCATFRALVNQISICFVVLLKIVS